MEYLVQWSTQVDDISPEAAAFQAAGVLESCLDGEPTVMVVTPVCVQCDNCGLSIEIPSSDPVPVEVNWKESYSQRIVE